ncbi:MAG TPA: 3'-5' exonuclease [Gallionella sp.]|nr:3'-5' exonuclease [Gallionella sp.]
MNKAVPTKDEIALLPPFAGLALKHIHVPASREEFAVAAARIKAAGIVGFDTESRPTFAAGEVSEGPHLVQFALHDSAYLFQMHHTEGHPFLKELLRSEKLVKVGFGLRSDSKHIRAKLGVELGGTVDLNAVFSADGYHKEMGVRAAVALVLNRRFAKSRRVTTSNWSQPQLTPQQMLYAANDAYAALKVLEALDIPSAELPVMSSIPNVSASEPSGAGRGSRSGRCRRLDPAPASSLSKELLRPWKLFTLAVGIGLLIWGSFHYAAPDWDIPISLIMALFAYLSAGWSMHVMVERRWRDFPLMLLATWWSVDGCYALYWYFRDPVALELMRAANAPASLSLYWMCGLVWFWNGSLKELAARLKRG